MTAIREIKVSEIRNVSDIDFSSTNGLSFFDPYLEYWVREILEIGGEVYASKTTEDAISGILLYEGYEKTGTICKRTREVSIISTSQNRLIPSSQKCEPIT